MKDVYLDCDMKLAENSSYCNWLVICLFGPKKYSPTELTIDFLSGSLEDGIQLFEI